MKLKELLTIMLAVLAVMLLACGGETDQEEPQETTDAEVQENTAETVAPETETEPVMTEEDKIAYVMENCICPQCPSWIPEASEKGEGGYCATGRSECIVDEAGCICPDCPVTEEMGLTWGYYCTRGSVQEMMDTAADTDESASE